MGRSRRDSASWRAGLRFRILDGDLVPLLAKNAANAHLIAFLPIPKRYLRSTKAKLSWSEAYYSPLRPIESRFAMGRRCSRTNELAERTEDGTRLAACCQARRSSHHRSAGPRRRAAILRCLTAQRLANQDEYTFLAGVPSVQRNCTLPTPPLHTSTHDHLTDPGMTPVV